MDQKLQLETKALTCEEVRKALAVADRWMMEANFVAHRNGLIPWLALHTGLRRSEIVELNAEDCDFAIGCIRVWRFKKMGGPLYCKGVPHTGRARDTIWISADLQERLRWFGADQTTGPLLLSHRGTRLVAPTIDTIWRHCLAEAGVRNRGIHAARHTYGSFIALKTRNVFAVRDALGHSDKSIGISAQYVARNPMIMRSLANTLYSKEEIA